MSDHLFERGAPAVAPASPTTAPPQPAGAGNAAAVWALRDAGALGQADGDGAAAAAAGLSAGRASLLGRFGLSPAQIDADALSRLAAGLSRLDALSACPAGAETCPGAGPGLVSATTSDAGGEQVVADGTFTLRLSWEGDLASGEVAARLSYEDLDGNYVSGLYTGPWEALPSEADPPEVEEDTEGFASFLEGALLGDYADNETWSALAGQVAMGFVPVAGQAADVRDLSAALGEWSAGEDGAGWRVVLGMAGFAPLVGDLLKGAGRGLLRGGDALLEGAGAASKAGKLSSAERALFGEVLGAGRLAEVEARYGEAALRHYGPEFFRDFQGVTDETMSHLLKNDGIRSGAIKGCHDADAFLDELVAKGNGEIVSATPHPANPDIVRYEYRLYRRDKAGAVEVPPTLQAGAPPPKTVINGLAANSAQWREIGAEAVEMAVRLRHFDVAKGRFTGSVNGLSISGFIRNGRVDTFFPEW